MANPIAVVFKGSGGCDDCVTGAVDFLAKYPNSKFGISVVKHGHFQPEVLTNATLWVQPGDNGDVNKVVKDFSKTDLSAIEEWVRNGGNYLGLCMGAYLAGSKPGFGFIPRAIDSYVGRDEIKSTKAQLVDIHWSTGADREFYFQDGCFFKEKDAADKTVLGRYQDGSIAAMVFKYGKGKVGVSGPHPEATRAWGKHAPDNYDLGFQLLDQLLS